MLYMGEKYEEEVFVSGYRCDLLFSDVKFIGVVIEVDGLLYFVCNDCKLVFG